MPTHEVLNQAPPLQDHDPFALDLVLQETLRREGAAWAEEEVGGFARRRASRETIAWGFQANENPPRLRTHDRFGNRLDEVEFHPAWHELMRLSVANGVHAGPWRDPPQGAHTTRAVPIGDGAWALTGHKWFCSAPMCDAFLVLAQAPRGLSCFLLPRITPDGERNRVHVQRLKDKLGNRSNASSEIELAAAWARRVGEEG